MKKTIIKLIIIVLLLVFIFIFGKRTYSALFSSINGDTSMEVGTFNILLNGQNINTNYDISLSNISWTNTNASMFTVAPGSSGILGMNVDASNTDVAVSYTISFDDHVSNPDKVLTVTKIAIDDVDVVVTNNAYTGLITLADIDSNTIRNIKIYVSWVNNEANNATDSLIGLDIEEPDYLSLNFKAEQYNG